MSAGLYEQTVHTKENMGLAPSQLKLLFTKTLNNVATIITNTFLMVTRRTIF